jgi:S1-C subfamily serine protease
VHLELKGQTFLLSLRGNPKLSAASPIVDEEEEGDEEPAEPSADATVRTQPLFYEDTVRLLTSVSRATANATPTSAAQAPGATAESLSAKLGELLGVPAGAKIVAVDGVSVQSPQEVIDRVVPLLGLGRAVRLNLTDAGDLKIVYITPVEEN